MRSPPPELGRFRSRRRLGRWRHSWGDPDPGCATSRQEVACIPLRQVPRSSGAGA